MTRFRLEDLPVRMRAQASAQMGARPSVSPAPPAFVQKNKYRAQRVFADGRAFGSKKEHRRYLVLVARERAGEISGLRCHVKFSLFDPGGNCRGEHIGTYTCDFSYWTGIAGDRTDPVGTRRLVVEDVKSRHTAKLRDWKRTKKLMRACHGHDIVEVFKP